MKISFFRTDWIDSQSRNISSDGKIDIKFMVQKENCNGILNLLEERKPRLIILIGISLIEVTNDINIRPEIVQALGNRGGNAKFFEAEIPSYDGKKFHAAIQEFENSKIICLPHTATIGLSDDYVMALKPPEEFIRLLR